MSSNLPPKSGIPRTGIPKGPSSTSSRQNASTGTTGQPKPSRSQEISSRTTSPSALTARIVEPPDDWTYLEAKYKQDIEALTESTEMATIEKEIAEEKLDSCEKELQELKDKLNDAMMQIDMLKREQPDQHMATSGSESSVTIFQLQKVEEQNELLKQALLRLRDISTNDKQTIEDLTLECEELKLKVLDLEDKEQKFSEQIKVYEEQIDVNQSSHEMVEKLTQQKTDLEDKLKEMVDDIDCMEKLRDLNEQLLENARENEIELTEELDRLKVQYSDLSNKKRDIEDYLLDQERSVAKLKEENRYLSDQVSQLKDQFKEGESIEQQKHQIENVAYKLNFSESKMAEKEAEIARCKRNLSEMEEQMTNLSLITKEQSNKIEELKLQLESKVSENSELQRALKKKIEEVSELEIRREMAEKKLQSIQRETEGKIGNLNRTIETMKGIEVQREEDIRRLMEDNELIERERRELRDQLNKSNRSLEKSMQTGNVSLSMMTAQDTSLASLGISFQNPPSHQASPVHHQSMANTQLPLNQSFSAYQNPSPHSTSLSSAVGPARHLSIKSGIEESVLIDKLNDLSSAFDQVNRRNYELELELAYRELGCKEPMSSKLFDLSAHYNVGQVKSLNAEVNKLKREVRSAMINQQIFTKSRSASSQARSDRFNKSKLAMRYQILENEANALMSSSSLSQLRPRAPLQHSTPVK